MRLPGEGAAEEEGPSDPEAVHGECGGRWAPITYLVFLME